jgi:hypothetical protein
MTTFEMVILMVILLGLLVGFVKLLVTAIDIMWFGDE